MNTKICTTTHFAASREKDMKALSIALAFSFCTAIALLVHEMRIPELLGFWIMVVLLFAAHLYQELNFARVGLRSDRKSPRKQKELSELDMPFLLPVREVFIPADVMPNTDAQPRNQMAKA